MSTENSDHYFLRGGGEMGELIRAKDWSQTSLGDPVNWPQSLQTMVAVMLDNPFGMYIAWGSEYIQLYNDGYRPILGDTKHPQALGISTWETFSEIWHIIESMFDGVMKGKAVGFPDLVLPLNRNGFVEECYFDFAYSPIRKDNGEVGGVLVTVIETTEKKRATEALKESNARFVNNVMQAPVAMCIFRGENYVVEIANKKMLNLWGKHAEQVMNKPIFEGRPEAKDQGLEPLLDSVFTTGEKFVANERPVNLPRNGKLETIYVNFVYEALKEPDATITGVVAIATDVTSQVLARKKIEESEIRLQLITDALPVLIAYIDKNRTYRFNNRAYETWFGHASKDITGKHIQDVLGEAAYKNLKDHIDKALSGQPVHLEISVPYKDGGTKWVVADYIPHFGKGNEVLGFYSVVSDVTAIKEAEKLNWNLAAIVQSSEDAIVSKTLEGIVTSWNPGAEKIFGYSASEMIGKPIHIITPPDRREEEPSLVKKISIGETVHHFETKRLHKDGKLIDISLTLSPIKDNEGNIIGASKIARDITESIEARKKIEQSEKQQAFLLKMSDELRPLVNSVDIEEAITKIALDFLEADRCYYCDIDEDSAIILRDAWRGDLQSVAGVHPISSFALYKAVIKAGHPFVIDDVQTSNILDEDLKKVCMQFQYGSFINVPVIKNGKPVGLFSVVQCKPRKWTEAEVQLTIETAERTWAAVERANGEEALRQSEEKYRTLFNSIDQGFLLGEVIRNNEGKGIDYYVHQVNSTYEKQTGINIEMVLGKTVLQAFPTIDKWWIETYASVVDNQYPIRFEKFFEFTNRWFEIKASPAGKEMFTILFTDITESRLAVEKIKESEERFRSLAQTLPQLVWMTDAQGNQEFVSFRWKEYSGVEPDSEKAWQEIVHPDDYDNINAAWTRSLTTGNTYTFNVRLKSKHGEYRWHIVKGEPILDQENKIVKWVGSFTDIHEHKKAEEQFRQMAERMPQKVWTADAQGNRNYFNQVMFDYTGLPFEELKDWGWKKIVHPEDWLRTKQKWEYAIDTGEDFENEIRLLRKDGKYLWHLGRATAVKDENDKPKMWIGSHTEIQEQIELSETLGENLKRSNERMQTILQHAPDAVVSIDEDGIIRSWNVESETIFGWKENEVIGKELSETIIPQRYHKQHNEGMKHFLNTGEGPVINKPVELVALNKNGSEFPIELKISTSKINNRYIFIGFIRDISIRKKAEEVIQNKTNQLIEAQALAHIGSWEWDVQTNKINWSDELYRIFGLNPQEFEADYENYLKYIHPDDRQYVHSMVQQALKDHQPYSFFHRTTCADGEVRILSATGKVLTDSVGNVIRMSGTAQDVTEQKKKEEELKISEERFYKIFDSNPVPMSLTEIKTNKIKYANNLFYQSFGYNKKEVIGRSSEELSLLDPEEYKRVVDLIFGYLQENRTLAEVQALSKEETEAFLLKLKQLENMKDFEISYTRKNGEKFPALVSFEVIRIGDESYTVTSYQDITERKKAEILLKNQNDQLETMNKELESFAYISSHDLQEPLRKIQIFVTRILEKEGNCLSDSGKDMFNRMQNSAKRMQTLIQDLLAYSRTSTTERKFETIALNKIIDEVKEDLEEELKEKHAIIEANDLCDADIIPFQFRQLMHNLIGNALKFSSPRHAPHIQIKSEILNGTTLQNERLSPQNKYCHITVSDNGIGFDQQYSEKIFGVFQRLHGRDEYDGTGIGLAIVKKIVDNHNGIITASGELNKGATFDIYIPSA